MKKLKTCICVDGWMDIGTHPLGEVDVELVEGDMSSSDEDFFHERVDSLENC